MTAEENAKGIDITIMDAINEDDDHPGCGQIGHGGIVEFNRSYGLEDHPFVLMSVDWHTPTKADVLIGVYQSEDDYQNGAPSTLRTIPVGPDTVSAVAAAIAALLAEQPCEHCEEPVRYCNKHQRWEHINGEACFLDGPTCEGE